MPLELPALRVRAVRYVGVRSGGLDPGSVRPRRGSFTDASTSASSTPGAPNSLNIQRQPHSCEM